MQKKKKKKKRKKKRKEEKIDFYGEMLIVRKHIKMFSNIE